MAAGLDAAIMNPVDKGMVQTLRAADALLGKDEYCREYLQGYRKGILT
jgi:5-methyltetrahydrofolate--homocysteine methyltransferase